MRVGGYTPAEGWAVFPREAIGEYPSCLWRFKTPPPSFGVEYRLLGIHFPDQPGSLTRAAEVVEQVEQQLSCRIVSESSATANIMQARLVFLFQVYSRIDDDDRCWQTTRQDGPCGWFFAFPWYSCSVYA